MDASSNKQTSVPRTEIRCCVDCGKYFLYRVSEQMAPIRCCPICRKAARQRQAQERAKPEEAEAQQARETKRHKFDLRLNAFNVVDLNSINLDNARILYILGNGFDLMHGVASSYTNFRNSMGKNNDLRVTLETYLKSDDLWSNFEEALAALNTDALAMGVVTFLQDFNAFDEDAQAADYYMAIDAGMAPADTITNKLQRYFRRWVESLRLPGGERPLLKLIHPDAKCLIFNYTEFAETLYGLHDVCYIHGDRRNKEEKLIIGHAFDDGTGLSTPKNLNRNERTLLEIAGNDAATHLEWYDEETSKNSTEIIKSHSAFFESLSDIDAVVVIGHSMSVVDQIYFAEITSKLNDVNRVHWYFGCYSLSALENMERLCDTLGIKQNAVSVFRTDVISVPSTPDAPIRPRTVRSPAEKIICSTHDGKWTIKTAGHSLRIIDSKIEGICFELIFPAVINGVFFSPFGNHLLVVLRGADPGIFVLRCVEDRWLFVSELEQRANQSIVNRRLRKVYLSEEKITFVYNNRVRQYSLADGTLTQNLAVQRARERSYSGQNISSLFIKAY